MSASDASTPGEQPGSRFDRSTRAAVFLTLLGEEEAANIVARLGPGQLEKLGVAMCELGEIDENGIAEALADFVTEADRQITPARDRAPEFRNLLSRSIGDTKAASVMQRIELEPRPRTIEMALWLAPSVLLALVEDEHPQVIAALLLMLSPDSAAQVLAGLDDERQAAVVERVARIGPISARAVDMIDALLSQRIGANFGSSALALGGPREAANLINLAAGDVRNKVLPAIAQRDGPLAEAIEEQLFTFEMLFELDAKSMGRLLRDVDSEPLIDALKGLKEAEREPFFAAMSSRAADGIRDEIEERGKLTRADVEAAQRKIVEIARKLADQGEIVIGTDDVEFV